MALTYRTRALVTVESRIDWNTPSIGAGINLADIPADASSLEVMLQIETAFNAGTSNTLNAGFSAAGLEFANNQAIGAAGVFWPLAHVSQARPLGSLRAFWVRYNQSGSAANAGRLLLTARFIQ